jgi:xanthine dehydrogenase molybdenum-binding subunit
MALKYVGKDFDHSADLRPKVTGRAKYAEDIRAEGMVFAKVYESPMPHAKVRNIDASEALAMDGVVGILTAEEVPHGRQPEFPILTNQPNYVGAPILAIAAITESIAAAAVEKVKIDFEPLPFAVDPLDSLFPGGPNAHEGGNVAGSGGVRLHELKWTAREFAAIEDGQLPLGQPAYEWDYGDLEAGFSKSALILDESFTTGGLPHHCMEPRTAMAWWEGEKCVLYAGHQSQAGCVPRLATLLNIEPENLVFINENCGGGFGSRIRTYQFAALPAYFSKKIGRPVMFRLHRSLESTNGMGRPAFQGRIKIGFEANGRIAAAELYIVSDCGANGGGGDFRSAARCMSMLYQAEAMKFRAIPVVTNTPPRGPQRGPGENQIVMEVEPLMDKAAAELGLDRIAIRKVNAPDNNATLVRSPSVGDAATKEGVTSAYMAEALDLFAERWYNDKKALSGQRNGSKVIGIGIGQGYHSAGGSGYDGLVRITPDGTLHIHNGVGNLGTHSVYGTSRVAAEVLDMPWENCVVARGDSRRGMPWSSGQGGSNTTYTHTRAVYVGAMDAKAKLLEIAAMDLGGAPEDYELKNQSVVAKADASKSITYAAAATRAIELGGKFSGEEFPEDVHDVTRLAQPVVAGTGLVGVAKDTMERNGRVPGLTIGGAVVEVDTETGKAEILEYFSVADVGRVVHPLGFAAQMIGGGVMGFGMAMSERFEYDPQNGLPARRGFHSGKLPTYLDVPTIGKVTTAAVEIPDPYNPMGGRGIGEPAQGSGAAAVLSAISDALGGQLFNRTPVVPDMIINAAAGRPQSYKPLSVNSH